MRGTAGSPYPTIVQQRLLQKDKISARHQNCYGFGKIDGGAAKGFRCVVFESAAHIDPQGH
jgi:hypothetical protein